MSNSLSSRIAVSIDRTSRTASRLGCDAEKILGGRWAPLRQTRGGERRPSRLECVVEHVPVGEVLDQETVGITPVVEDLAALDMPADPPRPVIAQLAQVFAARRDRVQIACLIGGVHIAVRRAQRQRQCVVVGGRRSAVAPDEAHRRAAVALAGVVHEVADDQPEVVEVPVQCLEVLGALQHDMTQPLHAGRLARRPLGGVGAAQLVPEVEGVRLLCGQLGQLMHSGDHADRNPAGIGQFYRDPADGLWQRAGRPPGRAGEPLDVGLVLCGERRAHKPRLRSAADDHARRAGVRSAKVKLVARCAARW